MASESNPAPSFSARQRWSIFVSVVVSTLAVFALVVMINYLGARYYERFRWSSQTGMQLSQQTISLVKSITNQVKVVVYYDKSDKLYSSVAALLDEYRLTNPKISVQTVDYLMEAAKAQQIKAAYKLGAGVDKNLVIFECEGRRKVVPASLLGDYQLTPVANEKEREYRNDLKAFEGERQFSGALLSVIYPRPKVAGYVEGHREPRLDDDKPEGYLKFKGVLEENNIRPVVISLAGTNQIPADCNLLIIAGPRNILPPEESEKIRQYLKQGGRLFALFNFYTRSVSIGLEPVLAEWNVNVGMNQIEDPENTQPGGALVVTNFNRGNPLVAPLEGGSLAMVFPRSVEILSAHQSGPEAPNVEELAWTGPNGRVADSPASPHGNVPLMVVVDKGSLKGVFAERRGSTAIVVAGDSIFLSNLAIDSADNRDFAGFAVNWLLDQTQLLKGVGPHPVKEYKLMMTNAQMRSVRWLFLAVMPGAILALGGLVWFRRRR